MSLRIFLVSLVSAALLASAAGAQMVPAEGLSRTVFVGDLNLSNPAGARIALQRIEGAASAVCGELPDPRQLERAARYRACVDVAVDRAVASLDSTVMTGLRAPHGASVVASDR
jgi:UrcA family protein